VLVDAFTGAGFYCFAISDDLFFTADVEGVLGAVGVLLAFLGSVNLDLLLLLGRLGRFSEESLRFALLKPCESLYAF
jgi:hypothetical protein